MLNIAELLIEEVERRLAANFALLFGREKTAHLGAACRACRRALTRISASNALYHNIEHTVLVLIVGIQTLLGRHIERADVTREDWLNVIVALVCHDIGYVRGICAADEGDNLVADMAGARATVTAGSSDAALMPLHVDRGKLFVAESVVADIPYLDLGLVQACIERTRFPVPKDPEYLQTGDLPGLVRGADLIGQLSDVRYLAKLSAVFFEFEEIGFNTHTGYRKPGDLLAAYPVFFANQVVPYIGDTVRYLEKTRAGQETLASLYGNLASAERARAASGA